MEKIKRIVIISLCVMLALSVIIIVWNYVIRDESDANNKESESITTQNDTSASPDQSNEPVSDVVNNTESEKPDQTTSVADQTTLTPSQTTKKPESTTVMPPEVTYDNLDPETTPASPPSTELQPPASSDNTSGGDNTTKPELNTSKPNNDGWSPDYL